MYYASSTDRSQVLLKHLPSGAFGIREPMPCKRPELWSPQDGAEDGRGCKPLAHSPRAPGWVWARSNAGASRILGIHVKQNHFSTTGRPESHTQTSYLVSPPCSFSPLHRRGQCAPCRRGALSNQKGPAAPHPGLLSQVTNPAEWGRPGFSGVAHVHPELRDICP